METPDTGPEPKYETEVIRKPERTERQTEIRSALIKPQEWVCPFCLKGNGIPEIEICKCGAVRKGDTAVK